MTHDIQPRIPTALTKTSPINASNLLCMIVQRNTIELEGFHNPKSKFFAPGVRFVGLSKTGRNDLGPELAWQGSRTRKVLLACVIMLSLSLILASILFRLAAGSVATGDQGVKPAAWTVQKVELNGLRIRSGANEIHIPVGGRLPNGDPLTSVSAERMSYSTPAGVTTLSSQQSK